MGTIDRADWHDDAAFLEDYVYWLVGHGLVKPSIIPSGVRSAVMAGDIDPGSVLASLDGKLLEESLTTQGKQFTLAFYERYLDGVDEGTGHSHRDRLGVLDAFWRQWSGNSSSTPTTPTSPLSTQTAYVGDLDVAVPSIESALRDVADVYSVRAREWRVPYMRLAARDLGVSESDACVTFVEGSIAERSFAVAVYTMPGATRDRLFSEFSRHLPKPARSTWQPRTIGSEVVLWARGSDFEVVIWAADGVLVHVPFAWETAQRILRLLIPAIARAV